MQESIKNELQCMLYCSFKRPFFRASKHRPYRPLIGSPLGPLGGQKKNFFFQPQKHLKSMFWTLARHFCGKFLALVRKKNFDPKKSLCNFQALVLVWTLKMAKNRFF